MTDRDKGTGETAMGRLDRSEVRNASAEPRDGFGGGVSFPSWIIPLLLAGVTLALFREFVFGGGMLLSNDTLTLGFAAREFYAETLRDGSFPLWNPRLLGGMPFLEALAGGDSLYPPSALLFLIFEPYRALGWKLVLHTFLGGLFMAGWVRSLGRSRAAALVAALAFAVAPFLVTLVRPGHDGKIFVTALTPLLFWAMETSFLRRGLLPYVGIACVVALVILTTHFQLAYFLFGAAGLYYAFKCVGYARVSAVSGPRKAAGRFGLFIVASMVGSSVAGVQLIPAYSYVTEYSRRTATTTAASRDGNKAYASSWSMHPEEVVGLIVPEFPGNNAGGAEWTNNTYWGRNPTRDNHQYAGIVVLALALAGFFGAPGRGVRWAMAGLGCLSIGYALGTHSPLWHLMFAVVPGIQLFRAPDMVAFLFGFAAVTLSAFGTDRLLMLARRSSDADRRVTTVLAAVVCALAVAMVLASSGLLADFWTTIVYTEVDASRLAVLDGYESLIARGFFIAAALVSVVVGVSIAARKAVLTPAGILAVLVVVVVIDGGRISAPFVQTLDFAAWNVPDPLVQELVERQRIEDPFRVASLERVGQEVKPSQHGLELATGHHPNDLARYRQLIGMDGSGMPWNLVESPNVRRVLNVRYLIWPDREFGTSVQENAFGPGSSMVARTQLQGQVYQTLYQLPTLPRARLVASAQVVPDQDVIPTLLSAEFDPASEVLLAEDPPVTLTGGLVEGSVEWELREPNHQRLRITSDRAALLVIADNWFPAWTAKVDGAWAPVLRAYHSLRAVPVPAGTVIVDLSYSSSELKASFLLSLASLLLLVGAAAFSWVGERRGAGAGG